VNLLVQTAFMTTSEIISHLGFGRDLTANSLNSLPCYIHMLKPISHTDYGEMDACQLRLQSHGVALQYRNQSQLEEHK
jgi:hypothetical protein